MIDRERLHAVIQYQTFDRLPICDFGYWEETIGVWYEQGLPRDVVQSDEQVFHEFFGLDFNIRRVGSTIGV